MHYSVGWLFKAFNYVFEAGRRGYVATLRHVVLRHCGISLFLYVGLIGLTWLGFHQVPGGFIPPQDKGNIFCYMQLPDGASLQRTAAVSQRVAKLVRETPGISAVSEFQGLSLVNLGNSANASTLFIRLAPFDERSKAGLTADVIMRQLRAKIAQANIQDAFVGVFGAPPVDGLGTLGGFKLQVEDRANLGFAALQEATTRLAAAAYAGPADQRRALDVPRPCAAGVSGRGPREGRIHGRAVEQCLGHVADLPRLALRQRLHLPRSPVPRHAAGGRAVPGQTRGCAESQDPQCQRRDGPVGHAGDGARHHGAGAGRALQHVSDGRNHRQPRAGRQFGRGDRAYQ